MGIPLSPTRSPSVEVLTSSQVHFESEVQIEMQNISSILSNDAVEVFEESCVEFLSGELASAVPPVFNISCAVKKQQLLGRRLNGARLRRLSESQSLLIDIDVSGYSYEKDVLINYSSSKLSDLVYESLAVQSAEFIKLLKENGDADGIDNFGPLDGLKSIKQIDQKSSISTTNDSDSGRIGKQAATFIIVGSFAGVVLLGVLFYHARRACIYDSTFAATMSDDDYDKNPLDALEPNSIYLQTYQKAPVRNEVSGTTGEDPFGDYTLNNIRRPQSWDSKSENGVFYLTSSNDGSHVRVRREVMAPPGKLGIVIETTDKGPLVYSVKPGSVMAGMLFDGDLIIALDDENTTKWSAHTITKMIEQKSRSYRKITVLGRFNVQC